MNKQSRLHFIGNFIGLLMMCFLLIFVFVDQVTNHDLPCPLCLLQRTCYIAIGLCFVMNLHLGIKPSHYGLMLLATLLGLGVAIRQIFIHLPPNEIGYGIQFWGLYLYTWSAIGFIVIITLIAVALLLDQGLNTKNKMENKWITALMCLFLILILANGISTFILCGPHICPDHPTHYFF